MNLTYLRLEVVRVLRNKRVLIFSILLPSILLLVIGSPQKHDAYQGTTVAAYIMVSMGIFGAMSSATGAAGSIAVERGVAVRALVAHTNSGGEKRLQQLHHPFRRFAERKFRKNVARAVQGDQPSLGKQRRHVEVVVGAVEPEGGHAAPPGISSSSARRSPAVRGRTPSTSAGALAAGRAATTRASCPAAIAPATSAAE